MASVAGIAGISATNAKAGMQLVYRRSEWDLTAFDSLARGPARVKQLYDITAINNGNFLNNIKNSLNGLHFGFGVSTSEIQITAALHGPANLLNFDDFIWQKYKIGEWLKIDDPKTGRPAVRNVFFPSQAGKDLHYGSDDPDDERSRYQDKSLQGLQARGVQLL